MNKIKKNKWFDFDIFSVKITYLSLAIIIAVILSIINPAFLYVSLVIITVITAFTLYICVTEIKSRKYRIEELSKSVDIVLKDSLNLINIPMVMIGEKTNIIWQNNLSKHILPKEYIVDSAVKLEAKLRQNETATVTADIGNGDTYLAMGNYIKFANFDCMLVSYINKTEEGVLKKTLEDTKVAVGIIVVDNYEETMQGLSDIKKSEISSRIANEIASWVSENKGVITLIDKDRYVMFVEKQYIDDMEKNQFEILERVRNITDETKLPITISIGFSHNESTLEDRYKASNSALDIALGRGGDQVVIQPYGENLIFLGGRFEAKSQRSRVKIRVLSKSLSTLINLLL